MPILYIMCGPSGCGKTTCCENDYRLKHCVHVSRDKIRFKLVKEDEDYFAHETEVFRQFIQTIVELLMDGYDVVADATHLNKFSRRKLTQAIDMYFSNYNIIYVVFNVDVDTCLVRNANREGRAKVPEAVIRNMCATFQRPSFDEDERVIDIIEVKQNE